MRVTVTFFTLFGGVLLAAGRTEAKADHHWKYEDEEHWPHLCNSGKLQSPIALSEDVAIEKNFLPFSMFGYGQEVSASLKNNGHSAAVQPVSVNPQRRPEVSEGGLGETYQLHHLHFHWESEHVMENNRFPLELHLVHYAKSAGNLTNALKKHNGVAVFAVLFELSPDDDEDFKPLLQIIRNLEHFDDIKRLDGLVVKDFIPRDKAGFYRYNGSLTTPGCNEGVIWTVFTNTLPISESQVKMFTNLRTHDNTELKQNFRSLQDLNGRTVYLKVSPMKREASSSTKSQISLYAAVGILFSVTYYYRY